jgi:hypothetical protein
MCLHMMLCTGKIKRGLQRLISFGKSKSGKGARILRPGGGSSRKVRFNEDQHSSKSAAGQQQPGAAGTATAGVGAVKGSSINRKTAAAPGPLKSGLRFADPPAAATSGAAAGLKESGLQAAHAGSSQSSDEHPVGAANAGSSNGSKPSLSLQLQQPSSSGAGSSGGTATSVYTGGSGPTHASGRGARGSSGEDSTPGMMAVYLQQQSAQQPPHTPSFAAGSTSGNWEGLSRTDLAGRQSSCAVYACQDVLCLLSAPQPAEDVKWLLKC